MYLAVRRLDEAGERLDVGGEQFPYGAIFKNLVDYRMLVGQVQKRGLICGVGSVVVLLRLFGKVEVTLP